jgi:hypothetical protein
MVYPSMVVHNFDVIGSSCRPTEAQPELVVHSDAVLPSTVAFERFQRISRRNTEVIQAERDLQLTKLASRNRFNVYELLNSLAFRESLRSGAFECPDHQCIITRCVINVKRD